MVICVSVLCSMYCPPWFSDPIMMYDEGNSTQATYIIALSLSRSILVCTYVHSTNIDHCFLMLCQHQIEKVLEGKEGRGKYIYPYLVEKKFDSH